MSAAPQEVGLNWRVLAGVALALLVIAVVVWLDATRLPAQQTVGVGPGAGMRLVAGLVASLAIAHGVAALRAWAVERHHAAAAEETQLLEPAKRHSSVLWILAGLAGLMAAVGFDAGFILGATWLFVATARAFGQSLGVKSIGIGLMLSTLVFLFFTNVLSLGLPAGPLERLLLV